MKTRLIVALTLPLVALWAPADEPAAKLPAPGADVQDFVLLAEGRPLLVRAHVYVDGKPFRTAWEEFVGTVLKAIDTDGDGVLSKSEAVQIPPPQLLFQGAGFFGPAVAVGAPGGVQADADKDGKVTRAELGAYFRRSGAAPFQVQAGAAPSMGGGQLIVLGRPQAPPTEALNKAIFARLDTDKDGVLSREELARAPEVFAALDANDDEMVTPQEILPSAAPGVLRVQQQQAAAVVARTAPPQSGSNPVVLVEPGDSASALARRLLERYAPKPGARKLRPADIGLDEKTFGQLDADQDGELDTEELAQFAKRPADLEVTLRAGKLGDGEKAVEWEAKATPLTGKVKRTPGGLSLDLGASRVDLKAAPIDPRIKLPFRLRDQYVNQFKTLDRDNNGYLDAMEASQSPLYRGLFSVFDADHDGMLYEKEVVAYLDKVEKFQDAARTSCVTLTLSDRGTGLFDLLDRNRDGRLSVRELRQAPALIAALDRNGDGRLALAEVPRGYDLSVRPGPAGGPRLPDNVVVVQATATAGGGPEPPAAGPLWFRKMDRNRDGDLSRREFLGTDEAFRRADADGDGLISAAEAERADKELRKKTAP